jgi:hypothetical protein
LLYFAVFLHSVLLNVPDCRNRLDYWLESISLMHGLVDVFSSRTIYSDLQMMIVM